MAYIYKSFSKMFGVDEDDNSHKNKNEKSSNKLVKIVMKQPTRVRSSKNNIARRKLNARKYGRKLAKLSNDISQKTSEESKVLQIIEHLKYHPEKESEIMAKYGKLLEKNKHLFTEKNAYGKKPRKSKKSKKAKKSKKSKKN